MTANLKGIMYNINKKQILEIITGLKLKLHF